GEECKGTGASLPAILIVEPAGLSHERAGLRIGPKLFKRGRPNRQTRRLSSPKWICWLMKEGRAVRWLGVSEKAVVAPRFTTAVQDAGAQGGGLEAWSAAAFSRSATLGCFRRPSGTRPDAPAVRPVD